jgi:ubiquinone biosynthesis protein Coq4
MLKQLHLEQNCESTLQQCLDNYYQEHKDFYQPDDMDADSKKVFLAHDVCHIVFGADTNIRGETIVEQWILNATDVGAKNYFEALLSGQTTLDAVKATVNLKSIGQATLSLPAILKTFWRAKQIEPKWNFYNYNEYLHTSINQIREQYKIKII